jgi:hypothetical protein
MGVKNQRIVRGGKISFLEGGGIIIVFGPKYSPLKNHAQWFRYYQHNNSHKYHS